jgi:hypothetical protein
MAPISRIARILALLAGPGSPDLSTYPQRVCAVGTDLLAMTGAGLALMTKGDLGEAWTSDPLADGLEAAQAGLGEGPGPDAYLQGTPVLEPDLAAAGSRWPFYCQAALNLGAAAVFAFPLQVGVICLGVLTFYRTQPGFLSEEQLADGLVLADLATQDLLDLQALGQLPWSDPDLRGDRAPVHQATGMVAAQLNLDMTDALARLRAHAFASGSTIFDVAQEVLSRNLRFN